MLWMDFCELLGGIRLHVRNSQILGRHECGLDLLQILVQDFVTATANCFTDTLLYRFEL